MAMASLEEEGLGMAKLMDLQPVRAVKPKLRLRAMQAEVMRFMFSSL
jgi:hypothetical protein